MGATPAYGPGVDDEIVFEDYSSRHAATGGYLIGNNETEAGLSVNSRTRAMNTGWTSISSCTPAQTQ